MARRIASTEPVGGRSTRFVRPGGRRLKQVNERAEPPALSLFVSCILSLRLKDPRRHAGHTFHER